MYTPTAYPEETFRLSQPEMVQVNPSTERFYQSLENTTRAIKRRNMGSIGLGSFSESGHMDAARFDAPEVDPFLARIDEVLGPLDPEDTDPLENILRHWRN